MARGNERDLIYLDRADHQRFLDMLATVVLRYGWLVHAYCLMGNHYHLVIETPRPNLALGMRHLNGVYAQSFNRRYRRVGHLLQGRYKALLVHKERHLLELCRYVVLNPVRAGLCADAAAWRWSSYQATARPAASPALLTIDWVLVQCGDERVTAQQAYRRFVAEGLPDDLPERVLADVYLGDDDFVRRSSGSLEPLREIPRRHWQPLPPALSELFQREGHAAIRTAHHQYGYALTDIADHLAVHYATISRALTAHEEADVPQRKT